MPVALMDPARLGENGRRVLVRAEIVAEMTGSEVVDTAHLLEAMTSTPGTLSHSVLSSLGIKTSDFRTSNKLMKPISTQSPRLDVDPELETALTEAQEIADANGDRIVHDGHMLAATLKTNTTAAQVLSLIIGVDPHAVHSAAQSGIEKPETIARSVI